MKKIISVFLTLVLCVGLFAALSASAYAVKEESITFTCNGDCRMLSRGMSLNAGSADESGWVVSAGCQLQIVGFSTTAISRIEAVVSAGGENYGSVSVSSGTKQQNGAVDNGSTVTVTDINNMECDISSDNQNPVHISQVTVYYHFHSYQPVISYVCDCGEKAPDEYGLYMGSTLSGGNLAIVCAVAGVAVGMAVMFFIMKKKKPTLASGAEKGSDDEE